MNALNGMFQSGTASTALQDKDPQKAARIANTLAKSYTDDQVAIKVQATRQAAAWLGDRMRQLAEQAGEMATVINGIEVQHVRQRPRILLGPAYPWNDARMDHARIVLRKFQIERHGSQQLHVTWLEELDESPSTLMDAGAGRVATIVNQLQQLPFVVPLNGMSMELGNTIQYTHGIWATPDQISHEDDPIT